MSKGFSWFARLNRLYNKGFTKVAESAMVWGSRGPEAVHFGPEIEA
jgi:hypothetical protein